MNQALRIVAFKSRNSSDKSFRIVVFIIVTLKLVRTVKAKIFRIGAFIHRYYISFIILCGSVVGVQILGFQLLNFGGRIHKERINLLVISVNIMSAKHNAHIILLGDSIKQIADTGVVDIQLNDLSTICDIFSLNCLIEASKQNRLKCPEYYQTDSGKRKEAAAQPQHKRIFLWFAAVVSEKFFDTRRTKLMQLSQYIIKPQIGNLPLGALLCTCCTHPNFF